MTSHYAVHEEPDPTEIKRAALATAVLIGLFSLFAFAAPHDPTKVVAGIPCSVLSEDDVSAVLGTRMRLMPTTGTICHYVSTGDGASRALFVVARLEPSVPSSLMSDATPVSGLGDAAVRTASTLYVRYGSQSYAFTVVPSSPNDAPHIAEELRLAKIVHRPMIARNR
jgi:hypothetical protein